MLKVSVSTISEDKIFPPANISGKSLKGSKEMESYFSLEPEEK